VMVRIGGGWNTLDNYLARCDPCRSSQKSAVSPTSTATSGEFTRAQSPTTDIKRTVNERQRQPLSNDRLADTTPSSRTQVTMTTVATSGQQQQQRPGDLLVTSRAFPVCDVNCRGPSSTMDHSDERATETDDVRRRDSAAGERCCDAEWNGVRADIVPSTPAQRVQSSTSASDRTNCARSHDASSSCSCTRLMCRDDARRTSLSRRPSRIPVPLRVAALCRSHSASLLRTPVDDQQHHQHAQRSDSGLDLHLSPPQFD